MLNSSLKQSFIKYCENNNYEKNLYQLKIIEALEEFIKPKSKFFSIFSKKNEKFCFYLCGGVGVGKTMILNHFFQQCNVPKQRFHFNEFMISFHDSKYINKIDSINVFVKNLKKKAKLLYLDELQVTNIVDAMILGKLFETIFREKIKILISSNIKIEDLYKDGLQREQFLPFISLLDKKSVLKELIIDEDYRKLLLNKSQRAFYPLNERTSFKVNKFFRELTKHKKFQQYKLNVRGRELIINEFYEGIVKFDFKDLCKKNLGAEDFIEISNISKFIIITNIPNFNDTNADQQQRFITLIDILYEKKVYLLISMTCSFVNLKSASSLVEPFKRTQSRLIELTSTKDKFSL